MPVRTLTMRGMRALAPQTALPRETQAAAKALQTAESMADKLVAATTKERVSDVLSEAYAQTMMDLAIRRDPHVSMWGRITYALSASAATVPGDADFFDEEIAAGEAGSGVGGVNHNLITAHKPLKPCLVHNLACCVAVQCKRSDLANLYLAELRLLRHKDAIFELPLISALQSLVWMDPAGTASPVVSTELSGPGGIELEGHGAPFLLSEDLSLELIWPAGASFSAVGQGNDGLLIIVARIDGESMEV